MPHSPSPFGSGGPKAVSLGMHELQSPIPAGEDRYFGVKLCRTLQIKASSLNFTESKQKANPGPEALAICGWGRNIAWYHIQNYQKLLNVFQKKLHVELIAVDPNQDLFQIKIRQTNLPPSLFNPTIIKGSSVPFGIDIYNFLHLLYC